MDRDAANYVLEDTRLSTLQRKLVKEGDESVAVALALHINECLLYPENGSYVSRSSDLIQDGIMEVVRSPDHSWHVKQLCALGVGRVGSLHPNYLAWTSWVWKQYDNCEKERLQTLYLTALQESIVKDGGSKEGITKLLETLKTKLEETNSDLIMLSLLGVMEAVAKYWGGCFKVCFTEVVDIVVGWFMESHSLPDIRTRIGRALIDWAQFWQGEVEFAMEQVGYFIEDLVMEVRDVPEDDELELDELEDSEEGSKIIEGFVYKWSSPGCDREEREKAVRQSVAFIQMIDCVLAGLNHSQPGGSSDLAATGSKVGLWLEVITRLGRSCLEWRWLEDLALSWTRCVVTCLSLAEKVGVARLQARQDLLTDCLVLVCRRAVRLSWVGQRALLASLHTVVTSPWLGVEQLRTIVQAVLGERGLLPQVFLQTSNKAVHCASVRLVQELLQSKNVVILQDVYSLLCMRLEQATVSLNNDHRFLPSNLWEGVRLDQGTATVMALWVLACLGKISTVSGSILSMWALDPPIFQLLSQHSGLTSPSLAHSSPPLVHSAVSLLLAHTTTHSYFISSSGLLLAGSTSPTANNLSQLIILLSDLQANLAVPLATRKLVVKTLATMLTSMKTSAAALSVTTEFQTLVESTMNLCYDCPQLCPALLENLNIILDEFPLSIPTLVSLTFLLLHLAKAGDRVLAKSSRKLLAKIPPQITFSRERAKQMEVARQEGGWGKVEKTLLDIFKMEVKAEGVRSSDFKDFMLFLTGEPRESVKSGVWRTNILEMLEEPPAQLVAGSQRLQTVSLAWTVAQFCVLSKLRTPLGKAQDTLGHIDSACRKLAGLTVEKLDIRQAQAMLDFAVSLEKTMVNGWDGSVIAPLPSASKSTQIFFYTNRPTCQDWLSRVRPSLMRLAFAAGQYSECVRQAWYWLATTVRRGELDHPASLGLVHLVCLALSRLDAPHHLSGLYSWAKEKSGTKLRWIQALIELVKKQTETGVRSIQNSLEDIVAGRLSLGMEESGHVLQPRLEELLYRGYESLSDHQTYLDWVTSYRESQAQGKTEDKTMPGQDKYLIALSRFQDGIIPVAAETLEPGQISSQGSVVQQMLEDLQIHLLQAGACLQNTFMRSSQSWSENEKLGKSLTSANQLVQSLLTVGCVTDSEQRKILLLNMICQELVSIKDRSHTMLARILKIEKGCSSSELLLIIKKWGEFFLRFRKNNPELHYQINNINLEIARVARKEKNLGLSEKFLLRTLTGRSTLNFSLEEFVQNYDFFSSPVSSERVCGLRQAGKVFARKGGPCREVAVRTLCGLVLSVGQSSQFTKQPDLLEQSSRALLNLAEWLREDTNLLESVYPEMKSSKSDHATLTAILHMESVTVGSRESLQKTIPVSRTSTETDLLLGRLLRLAIIQVSVERSLTEREDLIVFIIRSRD